MMSYRKLLSSVLILIILFTSISMINASAKEQDNVVFNIDEGINASYTFQTVGGDVVWVVYTYPSKYKVDSVTVAINDKTISNINKEFIGKGIYTYTFYSRPDDYIGITIKKGEIIEDEPLPIDVNKDNVSFRVDEGVNASYTRNTKGEKDVCVVYTLPGEYMVGDIVVKINGSIINSIKKTHLLNSVVTYTFLAKPKDIIEIFITKGALSEDDRFEFVEDDYLKSCTGGGVAVRIDKMNNKAICYVDYVVDKAHGVDAHFYVDDFELKKVDFKHTESDVFDYNSYSYTFEVGLMDKVVVRANSHILSVSYETLNVKNNNQTIVTEKNVAVIEKKANPMVVKVNNQTLKYTAIKNKTNRTVTPITVKKAKGKVFR